MAAPPAHNSPELHFHFINFFIQPSRVGSLPEAHIKQTNKQTNKKTYLYDSGLETPQFLTPPYKASISRIDPLVPFSSFEWVFHAVAFHTRALFHKRDAQINYTPL